MSIEAMALLIVLGLAIFCEARAMIKHDRPMKEHTIAIRKLADSAHPLKDTKVDI